MSIETSYRVKCSWCGASASYQDTYPSVVLAREMAVESGWRTELTHPEDLCPYCSGNACNAEFGGDNSCGCCGHCTG